MISKSLHNVVSSYVDKAPVGGIGVCVSTSDSVLLAVSVSRDVIAFRLF